VIQRPISSDALRRFPTHIPTGRLRSQGAQWTTNSPISPTRRGSDFRLFPSLLHDFAHTGTSKLLYNPLPLFASPAGADSPILRPYIEAFTLPCLPGNCQNGKQNTSRRGSRDEKPVKPAGWLDPRHRVERKRQADEVKKRPKRQSESIPNETPTRLHTGKCWEMSLSKADYVNCGG